MQKKLWTCSVCKQPIASGAGFVAVIDAKTRGYPRGRLAQPLQKDVAIVEALDANAIWARLISPHAFVALHTECSTEAERSGYWIDVERLETLDDWVRLVHHLCEKNWMDKLDIAAMLAYWWTNAGQSMYSEVHDGVAGQ